MGTNRFKGRGWPPEKDEVMMSNSPKRRKKFPLPGEAADPERGHMSGLSRGKVLRGREGKRQEKDEEYKL